MPIDSSKTPSSIKVCSGLRFSGELSLATGLKPVQSHHPNTYRTSTIGKTGKERSHRQRHFFRDSYQLGFAHIW